MVVELQAGLITCWMVYVYCIDYIMTSGLIWVLYHCSSTATSLWPQPRTPQQDWLYTGTIINIFKILNKSIVSKKWNIIKLKRIYSQVQNYWRQKSAQTHQLSQFSQNLDHIFVQFFIINVLFTKKEIVLFFVYIILIKSMFIANEFIKYWNSCFAFLGKLVHLGRFLAPIVLNVTVYFKFEIYIIWNSSLILSFI